MMKKKSINFQGCVSPSNTTKKVLYQLHPSSVNNGLYHIAVAFSILWAQ